MPTHAQALEVKVIITFDEHFTQFHCKPNTQHNLSFPGKVSCEISGVLEEEQNVVLYLRADETYGWGVGVGVRVAVVGGAVLGAGNAASTAALCTYQGQDGRKRKNQLVAFHFMDSFVPSTRDGCFWCVGVACFLGSQKQDPCQVVGW